MSRTANIITKFIRFIIAIGMAVSLIVYGPKPHKIFPMWIGFVLVIPFLRMSFRGFYAYWNDEKIEVTMNEHLPGLYYATLFLLCSTYIVSGGIEP